MNSLEALGARLRAAYPELKVVTARLHEGGNQFNDVLFVNEELVLRFPRGAVAAATLAREVAVLRWLQGRLPLPVPHPTLMATDPATGTLAWMGYALLPGEPLWNEELAALPELDQVRIAEQLASFLHTLHSLPLADLTPELPVRDEGQHWTMLFAAFRSELYPWMRLEARRDVDLLEAELLADLRRTPSTPVLIHGDFGGGNILYDPATRHVSAVIDFGAVALGDPAVDVAALSCYGEPFLARGYGAYPAMAALLPRARLFRATFALQQALWALRTVDDEGFADGIKAYR